MRSLLSDQVRQASHCIMSRWSDPNDTTGAGVQAILSPPSSSGIEAASRGSTCSACCSRNPYPLRCQSGRHLDKFPVVPIVSYMPMEKPMDQQQVMRITKALADPTRFRILQAIAAAGE